MPTRSESLKTATKSDWMLALGIIALMTGCLLLFIAFALEDLIMTLAGIVLLVAGAVPIIKKITGKCLIG